MQKTELNAIQDHYPDNSAWCYGCGRLNENGHHFRTKWQGDHTVTIFTPRPEHMAIPGFVYGGIIASLIDCHGSGSCSLALHRRNNHEVGDETELPPRFVAASLKIDFLKPTPLNVPLKAIGIVSEIHPKRWKVETQVFADEVLRATGEFIGVVMPKTFFSDKKI